MLCFPCAAAQWAFGPQLARFQQLGQVAANPGRLLSRLAFKDSGFMVHDNAFNPLAAAVSAPAQIAPDSRPQK